MTQLGNQVSKVRSKNAGPFWVTVDVFCGERAVFDRLCRDLSTTQVAKLYRADPDAVKRFEISDLNVIKFSFPRPVVQAAPEDRDQHGAQYAVLLEEMDLGTP